MQPGITAAFRMRACSWSFVCWLHLEAGRIRSFLRMVLLACMPRCDICKARSHDCLSKLRNDRSWRQAAWYRHLLLHGACRYSFVVVVFMFSLPASGVAKF